MEWSYPKCQVQGCKNPCIVGSQILCARCSKLGRVHYGVWRFRTQPSPACHSGMGKYDLTTYDTSYVTCAKCLKTRAGRGLEPRERWARQKPPGDEAARQALKEKK